MLQNVNEKLMTKLNSSIYSYNRRCTAEQLLSLITQ